jgi:hypothetical protein
MSESNIKTEIVAEHPELKWMKHTRGWIAYGLLTIGDSNNPINNADIKRLFSEYNNYLNGVPNYKNVPVFWRYEESEQYRIHIHYIILKESPNFHYLNGSVRSFKSGMQLKAWLVRKWREITNSRDTYSNFSCGIESEIRMIRYILKPRDRNGENSKILKTHFTPPIDALKRHIISDICTLGMSVTGDKPMCNIGILSHEYVYAYDKNTITRKESDEDSI